MTVTFLWNTDFFEWATSQPGHSIDTIITDPPYKSFLNQRGERKIRDKTFDVEKFCKICLDLLKPDGLFVSFCSMQLMKDYFIHFNGKLRFRCEQVWDKRPARSWVHYTVPLHHVEYIVYFGEGEIDFRTGDVNKKYKRNVFGTSLQVTKKNERKFSQGQFQQIIELSSKRRNIENKRRRNDRAVGLVPVKYDESKEEGEDHPTPKPAEFSPYFKQVIRSPGKVLDPCCGRGSLIWAFDDATGVDIGKWDPVSFEVRKEKERKLDEFIS